MNPLLIFLFLVTKGSFAHAEDINNETLSDDNDNGNAGTHAAVSSVGAIIVLIIIGYCLRHYCCNRNRELPPERLRNEDDGQDNPRRNRNNWRNWRRNRRNRNYNHNPNPPMNVNINPVISVAVPPQVINPPPAEGLIGNTNLPTAPPAYNERPTNHAYAPNFMPQMDPYSPACNANNPAFAPDFNPQRNASGPVYSERQNNPGFAPNWDPNPYSYSRKY